MRICLIAAVADNNVIGYKGEMPWYISGDLRYFKETTVNKCCIMGKNTALNLCVPLKDRINIVMTSNPMVIPSGFLIASNMQDALAIADKYDSKGDVFVIGGQSIYEQFLPYADMLYITEIYREFEGDTFFPEIDATCWKCIKEINVAHNIKNQELIPHSFKIFIRR